ncbi:hypothetical protein SAMN03159341_101701 [Paenibacillus sp. 1_12]|nr:hypothetical protein SAMN03159341_101701 [Paenibacillus sp. 1_12]
MIKTSIPLLKSHLFFSYFTAPLDSLQDIKNPLTVAAIIFGKRTFKRLYFLCVK